MLQPLWARSALRAGYRTGGSKGPGDPPLSLGPASWQPRGVIMAGTHRAGPANSWVLSGVGMKRLGKGLGKIWPRGKVAGTIKRFSAFP